MKITTACSKDTNADIVVWLKQNDNDVHIMGKSVKNGVEGVHWYLATLKENGTIIIHSSVGSDLGMQLTKDGKIKIENH